MEILDQHIEVADSAAPILLVGKNDESSITVKGKDGRVAFDLRSDGFVVGHKARIRHLLWAWLRRRGSAIAGC